MVSIPDGLLERIDREARRRQASRSGFLREAALRELGHPDPDVARRALAAARQAVAGTGPFESAELIREERDARDERDRRRL